MAFDPDQFLAETSQPQNTQGAQPFNPDQFLADTMPAQDPRSGQAFLEGAGQAATLGHLPQLQAFVEPAQQAATQALDLGVTPADVSSQLEAQGFDIREQADPSFVERRDINIARQQQLQREAPGASLAGQVAGAVGTSFIPGGAAAKGVGALSKIARGAGTGAALGALQNPGDVEGEISPLQIGERIEGAKEGALIGGAFAGGAQALGKAAKTIANAPKNLKSFAELKALKASGAMLKDFRKALGKKTANRIGRTLLDEDIVTVGDSFDSIARKAIVRKQSIGEEIGELYARNDKAIAGLNTANLTGAQKTLLESTRLNAGKIASELKKDISKTLKGVPGGSAARTRALSELDEFAKNSNDLSLTDLRKLRSQFDELVNWSKQTQELPATQQQFVKIRNSLRDRISKRIKAADDILGGTDSQKINGLNQKFSDLAEVEKVASDRIAREAANRSFSLGDRVGGLTGAIVGAGTAGGPGAVIGALALATAGKLARQKGNPVLARTADKIGDILLNQPEILGDMAGPLIQSLTESPEKYIKALQKLRASNPKFRKILREKQEK